MSHESLQWACEVGNLHYNGDNAATTGNLTQEKGWDSTKGALTRPLGAPTRFSFPISTALPETAYDFYTGRVTSQTDADNNVTTRTAYDVFGRPTLVQEAYGSPVERRTATEYSDTARRVIVRTDLNTTGDGRLVTVEHYLGPAAAQAATGRCGAPACPPPGGPTPVRPVW